MKESLVALNSVTTSEALLNVRFLYLLIMAISDFHLDCECKPSIMIIHARSQGPRQVVRGKVLQYLKNED